MASPQRDTDSALPRLENNPGPVRHSVAEPHWFGIPASALLLCLGFAGMGAGVGLLAAGRWPWGLVLLGIGALLLVASTEALRRKPDSELVERSLLLVADGRSRAATSSQIAWARVEELRVRRRVRSRLALIEAQEIPLQRELGRAVWTGDATAEERTRARLGDLEEQRARAERELDTRLEELAGRIREARLPVDQTVLVAPNEPAAPYPPPDEGNPPEPARVPEPYPPPDEGTPPVPDPGQDEPN